jgi:Ca-activated chloride channel family protein
VKSRGDKVLERFAEMTGGRVFFPYKLQDVADAFTGIQEELRSQYAVAYKPEDLQADGRFRSVSIEPTKNKNLRVRARRGYFSPPKK